jgi:hypothetical protein
MEAIVSRYLAFGNTPVSGISRAAICCADWTYRYTVIITCFESAWSAKRQFYNGIV